jgi:CheY-like chemotaxis protein
MTPSRAAESLFHNDERNTEPGRSQNQGCLGVGFHNDGCRGVPGGTSVFFVSSDRNSCHQNPVDLRIYGLFSERYPSWHLSDVLWKLTMKRPSVLLADDNQALLEEVRALLEPEFEIVGEVGDGQALLEAAERLQPDVLIVDISMPVLSGIKAVRQLEKGTNGPKVIFLTVHQDDSLQKAAFEAGAQAYVVKMSAGEDLPVAIHEVLQGRSFISPILRNSP